MSNKNISSYNNGKSINDNALLKYKDRIKQILNDESNKGNKLLIKQPDIFIDPTKMKNKHLKLYSIVKNIANMANIYKDAAKEGKEFPNTTQDKIVNTILHTALLPSDVVVNSVGGIIGAGGEILNNKIKKTDKNGKLIDDSLWDNAKQGWSNYFKEVKVQDDSNKTRMGKIGRGIHAVGQNINDIGYLLATLPLDKATRASLLGAKNVVDQSRRTGGGKINIGEVAVHSGLGVWGGKTKENKKYDTRSKAIEMKNVTPLNKDMGNGETPTYEEFKRAQQDIDDYIPDVNKYVNNKAVKSYRQPYQQDNNGGFKWHDITEMIKIPYLSRGITLGKKLMNLNGLNKSGEKQQYSRNAAERNDLKNLLLFGKEGGRTLNEKTLNDKLSYYYNKTANANHHDDGVFKFKDFIDKVQQIENSPNTPSNIKETLAAIRNTSSPQDLPPLLIKIGDYLGISSGEVQAINSTLQRVVDTNIIKDRAKEFEKKTMAKLYDVFCGKKVNSSPTTNTFQERLNQIRTQREQEIAQRQAQQQEQEMARDFQNKVKNERVDLEQLKQKFGQVAKVNRNVNEQIRTNALTDLINKNLDRGIDPRELRTLQNLGFTEQDIDNKLREIIKIRKEKAKLDDDIKKEISSVDKFRYNYNSYKPSVPQQEVQQTPPIEATVPQSVNLDTTPQELLKLLKGLSKDKLQEFINLIKELELQGINKDELVNEILNTFLKNNNFK